MSSHVWTCLWSHSVWSAITFEWHFGPSPLRTIQESVCLPVSSKSSASICTYFKKNKFSVFCSVHRLVSACWASLPSCKNSALQTRNHYSCHRVQSSPFIPRWAPAVAEQLLFKCLLLVVPPFHFLSSPFSLFFFSFLSSFLPLSLILSFLSVPSLVLLLSFSLFTVHLLFLFILFLTCNHILYSIFLSFSIIFPFIPLSLLIPAPVFFHYLFDYLLSIFFSSLTSSLSSFIFIRNETLLWASNSGHDIISPLFFMSHKTGLFTLDLLCNCFLFSNANFGFLFLCLLFHKSLIVAIILFDKYDTRSLLNG